MRVLVSVSFKAPLGGLQAHVCAQLHAIRAGGHTPTLVCPPGVFAAAMHASGFEVVESDFSGAMPDVLRAAEFALVHAHPFAARKLGLAVARRLECPFVLTLHGEYTAALEAYASRVDLLITVSGAARDYIVKQGLLPNERVVVIPNGVDLRRYRPGDERWDDLAGDYPPLARAPIETGQRTILFASRLDADKAFILDVVQETWAEQARAQAFDLRWIVAGTGTEEPTLRHCAAELGSLAGRELVTFLGWVDEDRLARLYRAADLAVAPGRCALDCMACGTPVIALGSRGYIGLINQRNTLAGMHGNFGGAGRRHEGYQMGTMYTEIDSVVHDAERLRHLGQLGADVVAAFYDQRDLDRRLLACYRAVQEDGK